MRFVKMQGAGNDYVYVDCFREGAIADPAALSVKISDRHFGVGADGLILILPSAIADAKMRIFNADGSEGRMCGNGLRCVAKYLRDSGRCADKRMRIETLSGLREAEVLTGDAVRVTMGAPAFPGPEMEEICVNGRVWPFMRVSMGNPHAVLFALGLPEDAVFFADGPAIEKDGRFPEGVNVEFCQIIAPDELRVRVWERGSGETLACGSGACAALAACARAGRAARRASVRLPGGTLLVEWRADGTITLEGPAVKVFAGEW